MRAALLAAPLLLAACASAPSSPLDDPAPRRAEIHTDADGRPQITTSGNAQPVGRSYAAPAETVWPAALEAWARVGLPIDGSDPTQHLVQTRSLTVRRKLNGIRLSTYFSCGSEMTGLIADSWRLTLQGRMAVVPGTTPGTSMVTTVLGASALPLEGTSAGPTPCASTGRLEALLTNTLMQLLAARTP